jgi:hypothetical protein
VPEGKTLTLENAPVTTGGAVSLSVEHANTKLWRITIDPHGVSRDFVLHFPFEPAALIRIDGKSATASSELSLSLDEIRTVELAFE